MCFVIADAHTDTDSDTDRNPNTYAHANGECLSESGPAFGNAHAD